MPRISYWLMPVAGERDGLGAVISRLAGRFAGPVFEPHVTIYSGPAGNALEARRILKKVAAGGGVRLRCTGLKFSDMYRKACYLSFAKEPLLDEMSRMIGQMSACPEEYLLRPHLSLFYGRLIGREREEIREMIELPDPVGFGGLAAMATGAEVESATDVEEWALLDSLKL